MGGDVVEWEEPIKERRVWEKGRDDGVGSVCGDQDRVKGSGEGELAVLRGDGEFGLCGCGSMRELELGNMGSGVGAKKLGNFFHEGVSCFYLGLNGLECMGSVESEAVGESGVREFGSGVTL